MSDHTDDGNVEMALDQVRRERKLQRIRNQIADCTKCALSRTSKQRVPMSIRNVNLVDLVIVGEAPGKMEDAQGVPFVGRSGELLDKTLDLVGTSRDRCAVLNTVCCRPPSNRDPKPAETEACSGHFYRQLRLIDVQVGVLLGNKALEAIVGPHMGITTARGKPFWDGDRVWMPTYHPAFILRPYGVRRKTLFVDDIGMAYRMAIGASDLPSTDMRDAVALVTAKLGGEIVS